MAEKQLGFIGLGNMGAPMAGRLIDPRADNIRAAESSYCRDMGTTN